MLPALRDAAFAPVRRETTLCCCTVGPTTKAAYQGEVVSRAPPLRRLEGKLRRPEGKLRRPPLRRLAAAEAAGRS